MKTNSPNLIGSALLIASVCILAAAPGDLDPAYNPNSDAFSFSFVNLTATQPDGKLIIGGEFGSLGGQPFDRRIARLNPDGTVDTAFTSTLNDLLNTVTVQPDGKLVLGGLFATVNGQRRSGLARLNADGTLDSAFTADVSGGQGFVFCTALQPDGKILVGGSFSAVGATTRNGLARLNSNGSLDAGFNPNVESGGPRAVYSLAVQPDGKILLGGFFNTVGGVNRDHLARVNPDGTLDPNFTPGFLDGPTLSLAVQADGKVVAGGVFASVGGVSRTKLARLNADGSLDTGFTASANDQVSSLALQADGRLVVAGRFTAVNGTARNRIARLESNGTLDSAFDPNANSGDVSAVLQADGKLLLGGAFISVGGTGRNKLARLLNDAATQTLAVTSASRVQWLRGGSSPEALAASFELSTDGGTTWTALGNGSRITGGWERTGLALPASGRIRARARVQGGIYSGSGSLMETVLAYAPVPPTIQQPPTGQSFQLGSNVALEVTASGTDLAYQWQLNGTNLVGANTARLELTNLTATAGGSYTVIVSNVAGTATSARADLTFFGNLAFFAGTTLSGPIGAQFLVDYADVVAPGTTNWLPLTNVTLPYSPFLVIDPTSPGRAHRYYRATRTP